MGFLSLNDCINVELIPPMHVDAGMIVVVVVVVVITISRVVDGVRLRLKALVHTTDCPPCTGGHQNDVNFNVRSAKATTKFLSLPRPTITTQGS